MGRSVRTVATNGASSSVGHCQRSRAELVTMVMSARPTRAATACGGRSSAWPSISRTSCPRASRIAAQFNSSSGGQRRL